MKKMKAICTATALVLSLSVTAFAGDIAAPGAPVCSTIGTTAATIIVNGLLQIISLF